MGASKQVKIPFYRRNGPQRGQRLGADAQVTWRTEFPFLPKNVIPAAKRVGIDLLDFVVPENADEVSGRKKFKTTAKSVGRQTLRK